MKTTVVLRNRQVSGYDYARCDVCGAKVKSPGRYFELVLPDPKAIVHICELCVIKARHA